MEELKKVLENNSIEYKQNFPLKEVTFTKTGGIVEFYCVPKNSAEVLLVMEIIKKNSIPYMVIGNASNLIIADEYLEGVIINLTNMNSIYQCENRVYAQSGALLSNVSKITLEGALSGLEFACGIPGSVGGAICMNAGAYGGEMKDVVSSILVLTNNLEILRLEKHEIGFEYRNSNIKRDEMMVLEIEFTLEFGDKGEISEKIEEFTLLRSSKQPLEYPSCGSVFKRPTGYFAGKLIQDSGLQGFRIGGVEVSKKHAGFMINVDNGSAKNYIDLINHVQSTVKEKFNITLETEVKLISKL